MYISLNKNNVITAVSESFFEITGQTTVEVETQPRENWSDLVGKKHGCNKKPLEELKVAIICNWNDTCGISTYTRFLIDAMKPQVAEVRIFSEINDAPTEPDDVNVVRIWKRGNSMVETINQIKTWSADFVIIQHEFGIFPKATCFLQMLQMLSDIPHVVCVHSVYEHLDKIVCTSAIKNIIVHSEQGKECLEKLGNTGKVFVIPHGCVQYKDTSELWNIFQTPYALVQFGFGFFYKGVDRAIDAVHYLKNKDEKYKDIFYCYLCSDSNNFNNVHAEYYNFLNEKIEKLGIQDNVAIIRKYNSEMVINSYLRTAKIALFPYVVNPKHRVFGASGAIRVAMANKIPVVASESHQFDDLEGVVPRPHDYISLANEIDEIFSNAAYRNNLLKMQDKYIEANNWVSTAERYLKCYYEV